MPYQEGEGQKNSQASSLFKTVCSKSPDQVRIQSSKYGPRRGRREGLSGADLTSLPIQLRDRYQWVAHVRSSFPGSSRLVSRFLVGVSSDGERVLGLAPVHTSDAPIKLWRIWHALSMLLGSHPYQAFGIGHKGRACRSAVSGVGSRESGSTRIRLRLLRISGIRLPTTPCLI